VTAGDPGCPSDLRLERHLLDPQRSGLAPHLAACERCRARLAEMERQGEDFRRFVYPATVDAVVERARPRRPRWLALVAVPVAAAAAAAVFLLVPRSPSPDYLGAKGGLALSVYVATDGGARAVGEGERVPADAAVRFQVHPAAPCRLWVASVDAGGTISRVFPPGKGGTGAELPPGAAALPGGAVLDGKPGPERFYAICVPAGIVWPEIVRAVADAAGKGPEAVRAPGALRGLPKGTAAASVLVEKGS
jgi:hypothetical protein